MAATSAQPSRVPTRPPSRLGELLTETGEIITFGGRTLRALPGAMRYSSEALRQTSKMIRGTWLLLFVMCIFFGITVVNFGFFLLRALGATDYLGVFTGLLGTRLVAPLMFGYVFVGKVCCGFAAEIGAMKIQQEVDAYTSEGVDPMRYIVGTRLLAVLLFLPLAGAIALIGYTAGNFFDAVLVLQGISAEQLASVHWSVQGLTDQFFAFISMLLVAVPATIIACYFGLQTSGGPADVGTSAAQSVVVNLVYLHCLIGFTGVLFWGSDLRIPIGG